jgi:hypothetical protein
MAGRLKPGDETATEIRPKNLLRRRNSGSFKKCQRDKVQSGCSNFSELLFICTGRGSSPFGIL